MALSYAGDPEDPRSLNTLLTHDGGYNGHMVNIPTAVRLAARDQSLNLSFVPITTSDPNLLTTLLADTHAPCIVKFWVPPTPQAPGHWHYVLVTGKLGNVFTINDPGDHGDIRLDPTRQTFTTVGYIADPVDLSELVVSVDAGGDGVRISVTNAQGQTTGIDPVSGQEVNQIPGSVEYTDELESDEADDTGPVESNDIVFIPTPQAGQYNIRVYGQASAEPFTMVASSAASDGTVEPAVVETGTASPGSTTAYQYTFDPVNTLPVLSVSDVTEPKGHSGTTAFDFAVSLSSQPAQPLTLNYTTADDTASVAANDYQSASGSLTFVPNGPLTQTIQVLVNGNTQDKPDDTFFVELIPSAGVALGKSVGIGTIQDDSTPISINDVSEVASNNGTTSYDFTVSLAHASSLPVSVDYATADGTATLANGAYQAQAGTVRFDPGQTTQTVTIVVNANPQPHGDETFFVNLANSVNGIVAANGQQGVGTILANDTGGVSYYVNGPSTVGDVFCTAPGNDSNDGKSPATPVASLNGLLSLYTFHPGDTIYVRHRRL